MLGSTTISRFTFTQEFIPNIVEQFNMILLEKHDYIIN
jgi:hypothetical protein